MKKLKSGIRGSGSSGGNQMASVKAVALMTGDSNVRGSLHFLQASTGGPTHIQGRISGLSPGLHGFHIHALGDTSNGCNSTGPHFNPLKKEHGAPSDKERHAGDLGNIVAGPDGINNYEKVLLFFSVCNKFSILLKLHSHSLRRSSLQDWLIPLSGPNSILGRAVVVHADPDDLGKGGHELSKTTGNAGARVGCGIIGLKSSV
ncbi:hypothetical protein EV2_014121 [Malus domestica]